MKKGSSSVAMHIMWFCMSPSCLLTVGGCVLLALGGRCDYLQSLCGAQAPGDIQIGILSSSHAKVDDLYKRTRPGHFTCKDFDLIPFVRLLAAIHTIDTINDSGFLPGVRLGYIVCDPCADATKALHCVEHMLAINGSLPVLCDYTDFRPPVKVLLGARYSELSIAVAKLLSLYLFPQISCTSSAPILSDKLRYPSFRRTIPSDIHQMEALARLMTHFNWDWVGVVSGDDDYGKAALQSFLLNAEKVQVCVAFQEVVPHYLDHGQSEQRIRDVATQIRSSSANVVVLILKPELVKMLFKEMIRTNTTRSWIASDAWSMNQPLTMMEDINKVGNIFGFTFVTGPIPGFEQYLTKLRPSPGVRNDFIREYKQLRFNCTSEVDQELKSPLACSVPDPQEANDDFLVRTVDITEAHSERVAVWAIAHALKKLLNCNETDCPGEKNFPPWELLEKLQEVNFEIDNETFFFDKYGDFPDGYDFIMWVKNGDRRTFEVMGKFRLDKGEMEIYENKLVWDSTHNNTVPQSKCSQSCGPGTIKKVSNISCCYNCTLCVEGTYSVKSDQHDCDKCPNGTWSLKGWSECKPRTVEFLTWSAPYPIALMVGAGLGVVLLIIILIIFLVHRTSDAMKKADVRMCFFMKVGLMVSFGSVVAFISKPNIPLCQAQQVMYGLGFTLCVSCILVKAFRTFLAFLAYDPVRQHRLNKIYKPLCIMVLVTAVQGLVCTFWLIFDSPKVEATPPPPQSMTIMLLCSEGSKIGFGVMLGYIGLLAFICFLLAFKSRKVPHDYNETGNIIFSMLIYLFVWLCFIPLYITKSEQRPIVQASAILVSNYGIIFCHFIPKCYHVLWGMRENKIPIIQPVHIHTVVIPSDVAFYHAATPDLGVSTRGVPTSP